MKELPDTLATPLTSEREAELRILASNATHSIRRWSDCDRNTDARGFEVPRCEWCCEACALSDLLVALDHSRATAGNS